MNPDWRDDAACKGHPTEWWYPETGQNGTKAIAICAECPVTNDCADEGKQEVYGIWGGRGRNARAESRRMGLTDPDIALETIKQSPTTWVTPAVVAARSGIPKRSIGRSMQRLRDRGLLERHPDGGAYRLATKPTGPR